ncbi:hypothetical protein [Vitreimonas flagellata]|uniref:hypothetical protein n=1 Tax=Vitreimonas flagellata TaxID=2560861 RepID=UPI001075302E|nr:hypothetical protein [Vitreimonas flagellata]
MNFGQRFPERTRAPATQAANPALAQATGGRVQQGAGIRPLDLGVENIDLLSPMDAMDLTPLNRRGVSPIDEDPEAANRQALVDALDSGVGRPTVSGTLLEGLTRGGEAFFRARAARDERRREQDDRDKERQDEYESEASMADAIAAFENNPDDPAAAQRAAASALASENPEAAFNMLSGRNAQQLEMADALDLEERSGPIRARNTLFGQGYREGEGGEYERFGPAEDDWNLAQQNVGLGYARINDDNRREARADARAEASMRGEFLRGQGDFIMIRDAYSTINSLINRQGQLLDAGQAPSATTDMAIVFSYMKLLDPTSVVREGEFANAQNAAGVPDRIRNAYNRTVNGSFLDPNQRSQFGRDAQGIYATRLEQHERDRALYSDMASGYEFDPNRIAPNLGLPEELADTLSPSAAGGGGNGAGGVMDQLPDPAANRGRRIVDDSGQAYVSDGRRWVRQGARRTAFDGPRGPGVHATSGNPGAR